MKATLALTLLAALCVVVSGCGSSHRATGIGLYKFKKGLADCGGVPPCVPGWAHEDAQTHSVF
jgi:hypothetical protein